MNIRQATARFAELTGLPALSSSVFHGIQSLGTTVPQWFTYAWDKGYVIHTL